MRHSKVAITSALLASCMLSSTSVMAAEADTKKLLSLSLNELSDIEVTSVSKRSEKASEAPAAVFVITGEDIRRAGATSIPEALRMAPGLSVARSGQSQWAISARGFNDQFANKLLVLMDGRSVYTPLFSGVNWDAQDTMVEDIERIEVIRGPGATLWGANAVNGVINIITKKAKDTQGALLVGALGDYESGVRGRFGGMTASGQTHYRSYAKYNSTDDSELSSTHGSAFNGLSRGQAGFRVDSAINGANALTVQGDVYRATERAWWSLPSLVAPFTFRFRDSSDIAGSNILARLTHDIEQHNQVTLQMYVDHNTIESFALGDHRTTFDVDLQHAFSPHERHEIVWGGGYRLVSDDIDNTFYVNFTPASRRDNLFSFFVQDKITLSPQNLFLTLGSKFEHNDYTGFEVQPSARFSWLISDRHMFWASASRAVRTPNRANDDTRFALVFNGAALISQVGDDSAKAEVMNAYEMGCRIMPTEKTSVDAAVFWNEYDKLITNRTGAAYVETGYGFAPRAVLPLYPSNQATARSWGGELVGTWNVTSDWRVIGTYSLLHLNLDSTDASFVTAQNKSPQHQFNVRSHWNINAQWEMDNIFYYVDEINPSATVSIPDYLRFDTRIAYKYSDGVEIAVVGQNLLDDSHSEFTPFAYYSRTDVPRSVYGSLSLRF